MPKRLVWKAVLCPSVTCKYCYNFLHFVFGIEVLNGDNSIRVECLLNYTVLSVILIYRRSRLIRGGGVVVSLAPHSL